MQQEVSSESKKFRKCPRGVVAIQILNIVRERRLEQLAKQDSHKHTGLKPAYPLEAVHTVNAFAASAQETTLDRNVSDFDIVVAIE